MAALCRTRHLAELFHHAGHFADGGDRRHGHDLRCDHWCCDLHPRPKLSAGADGGGLQRRSRRRTAVAAGAVASRSLAALARTVVYRQRLFLSDRGGRTAAKRRPQAVLRASFRKRRLSLPMRTSSPMAKIEARLNALGLVLPPAFAPPPGVVLPFVNVRLIGNRAVIAGHGPQSPEGP